MNKLYKILSYTFTLVGCVYSHGFLSQPKSRNLLSNDYCKHCLNVGGLGIMTQNNKITRGLCGNSRYETQNWNIPGDIVKQYTKGQSIPITSTITAHHMGYFVVEICDNPNISEDCFKPLPITNTDCYQYWKTPIEGENFYQFMSDYNGEYIQNGQQDYTWHVQLPPNLECSHCVLRWIYYTTNSCPKHNNGQLIFSEQFVNCADISIGTPGIKQDVPNIQFKKPTPLNPYNFICPKINPGNCDTMTSPTVTSPIVTIPTVTSPTVTIPTVTSPIVTIPIVNTNINKLCNGCLRDYGTGTICYKHSTKRVCEAWNHNSKNSIYTWTRKLCNGCLRDYGFGTVCYNHVNKYVCESWNKRSLDYEQYTWETL